MTPQTLAECTAELTRQQAELDSLVSELQSITKDMADLAESLERLRDQMRQETGRGLDCVEHQPAGRCLACGARLTALGEFCGPCRAKAMEKASRTD